MIHRTVAEGIGICFALQHQLAVLQLIHRTVAVWERYLFPFATPACSRTSSLAINSMVTAFAVLILNQESTCRGVVHPHSVFFPGLHRIPCQSNFPIFIRVTSVRQKFPTSSFTNFARTYSANESFSCESATVRTVAEMEPLSMLAVSLVRREQLR